VGRRPFKGPSQAETMHAIIREPYAPLPSMPPELDEVLAKALAKETHERYQHVGDFALDLRRLQRAWEAKSLPSQRGTIPPARRRRLVAGLGVFIALAMAVTGWTVGRRRAPAVETPSMTYATITPFTTNLGYNGEATISPDGQTIAYVSDRTGRFDIFLRQVGSSTDVALTRDQGDNLQPAFSPDGRQIAFVSSRSGGRAVFYPGFDNPLLGGDIWVMPALGGGARRIVKDGNDPSWSPDGSSIVFTRNRRSSIFQVAVAGGEPREIAVSAGPREPVYPAFSSNGQWIFFEFQNSNGIFVVPAAGGAGRQIATGRHPVWDASAQAVIYSDSSEGHNHSLWTVPFSERDGTATGPPRPLTVGRGRDWQPAISRDGKLIAFTGIQMVFNIESLPFDAETGRVLGPPRAITTGNQISYFMRSSPDGRSVVFESARGAGRHIWRQDAGADAVQLTSDPRFEETFPQWSPDGTTIAFTRQPVQSGLTRTLWLMDADGSNPRQILEGNNLTRWLPDGSGLIYQGPKNDVLIVDLATKRSRTVQIAPDLPSMLTPSFDGRWIVYQSTAPGTAAGNVDVHAVPLDGGPPRTVVATPLMDFHPFFSPSGRWVYFQPDHKNLYRVPGPGQEWKAAEPVQITNFAEPGLFLEDPQISRDGKQLLYSRGRITGDIWILRRGDGTSTLPR
jgi:Tol biopolymer transport system component